MKYISVSTFKNILFSIKEFKDEAIFKVNDDNMSVLFVDDNHVLVVNAKINKQEHGTNDNDCIELNGMDGMAEFGLNLKNLGTVFKMASKSSDIKMSMKDNAISIGIKENKRRVNTKLNTIEIQEESLNIDNVEYTHEFYIDFVEFEKIIKELANFGDTCKMDVKENTITFNSSGAAGSYSCDTEEVLFNKQPENLEILSESFDITYLLKIIKASKISDTITIKMSKQSPICLRFDIVDSESFIEYYLAPKQYEEE
jgi:proliferating cell nuclear antigen